MAPPAFKVEISAVPGLPDGATAAPNAPLDAKTVTPFRAQIEDLRRRRFRFLILEMGAARFVNSTSLAYLITLAESLEGDGGGLALVNVPPKVKLILETMGLLVFIQVFSSKPAAIKAFKASARPSKSAAAPAPAEAPSSSSVKKLFRRLFGPPASRNPL